MEASASPKETLRSATRDLVTETSRYLLSEAVLPLEDYRALARLNVEAAAKYEQMLQQTLGLQRLAVVLGRRQAEVMPIMMQIDSIGEHIDSLEEITRQLDAHTRDLEARFRAAELARGGEPGPRSPK